MAKELTKIPKPLVGKSLQHINSTHDFVEQVKHLELAPKECLSSYVVSSLFTSVSVDPALRVIKDLLEKDPTLKNRIVLPVKDIIILLEFCLKNMYFSFQDQFYKQVEGAAMGCLVSPIVANLYMDYFEFVEQVKHLELAPEECLSSYVVSSLFTSVSIDPALRVIKDLLEKDPTLKNRIVLPVKDIILLLEFCLKNMYFSFQDQFYKQVEGAAMGCLVSPIVANLYMDYFKQKALITVAHPRLWGRYVDGTFAIQKEVNKHDFLQHINSVDPTIQFTVEANKEDGTIPFLDTIVKPEADGNLSITLYRKLTHTD